MSMQLKVEVRKDYHGDDYFLIMSDNLVDQLSDLTGRFSRKSTLRHGATNMPTTRQNGVCCNLRQAIRMFARNSRRNNLA
jgi:hypothetical protein